MTEEQKVNIKLEAFRLASLMHDNHSTEDFIANANKIYQSIIKQ